MKPQLKRAATIALPAVLLALTAAALFLMRDRTPASESSAIFVMDAPASIRLYGADTKSTEELLTYLDGIFNIYLEGSPAAEFNRSGTAQVNEDMFRLINEVRLLSLYGGKSVSVTCGALTSLWNVTAESPSVPDKPDIDAALLTVDDNALMLVPEDGGYTLSTDISSQRLDFGSVAKGYACDRLNELYNSMGDERPSCGIVSFGSSSLLYGEKPDGTDFRVEVRSPDGYSEPLGYITSPACFISTSGGYERFFEADGKRWIHILDLESGFPSDSDLASVTIVTDSGVKSDYLSTLVFLDGTAGLERHLSSPDFLLLAVDTSGRVYKSDGLSFELTDASHYRPAEENR